MKNIHMYIFIASILIIASCEKPTGEAPKTPVEDTGEEAPEPSLEDTNEDTPEPKQWHVSTVAGSARGHKDAAGTNAQFSSPNGIAVSPDGRTLYVADSGNHRIRKIDISSKEVTTIAGSYWGHKDAAGTDAQFKDPNGVAVTPDGTLYVTDGNHLIRRIEFR